MSDIHTKCISPNAVPSKNATQTDETFTLKGEDYGQSFLVTLAGGVASPNSCEIDKNAAIQLNAENQASQDSSSILITAQADPIQVDAVNSLAPASGSISNDQGNASSSGSSSASINSGDPTSNSNNEGSCPFGSNPSGSSEDNSPCGQGAEIIGLSDEEAAKGEKDLTLEDIEKMKKAEAGGDIGGHDSDLMYLWYGHPPGVDSVPRDLGISHLGYQIEYVHFPLPPQIVNIPIGTPTPPPHCDIVANNDCNSVFEKNLPCGSAHDHHHGKGDDCCDDMKGCDPHHGKDHGKGNDCCDDMKGQGQGNHHGNSDCQECNGPNTAIATGNILTNDSSSEPFHITQISFNGVVYDHPDANGIITINTGDGTLTLYTKDFSGHHEGDYQFTLNHAVDNPGGKDVIQNFIYTIATDDCSASASLTIKIVNDVPQAKDDCPQVVHENVPCSPCKQEISGNVLKNDILGADRPVNVTSISYDGGAHTANIPANGSVSVLTAEGGKLTVFSNGDWKYIPQVSPDDIHSHKQDAPFSDNFSYTITDHDGDKSTATQPIKVIEELSSSHCGSTPPCEPPPPPICDPKPPCETKPPCEPKPCEPKPCEPKPPACEPKDHCVIKSHCEHKEHKHDHKHDHKHEHKNHCDHKPPVCEPKFHCITLPACGSHQQDHSHTIFNEFLGGLLTTFNNGDWHYTPSNHHDKDHDNKNHHDKDNNHHGDNQGDHANKCDPCENQPDHHDNWGNGFSYGKEKINAPVGCDKNHSCNNSDHDSHDYGKNKDHDHQNQFNLAFDDKHNKDHKDNNDHQNKEHHNPDPKHGKSDHHDDKHHKGEHEKHDEKHDNNDKHHKHDHDNKPAENCHDKDHDNDHDKSKKCDHDCDNNRDHHQDHQACDQRQDHHDNDHHAVCGNIIGDGDSACVTSFKCYNQHNQFVECKSGESVVTHNGGNLCVKSDGCFSYLPKDPCKSFNEFIQCTVKDLHGKCETASMNIHSCDVKPHDDFHCKDEHAAKDALCMKDLQLQLAGFESKECKDSKNALDCVLQSHQSANDCHQPPVNHPAMNCAPCHDTHAIEMHMQTAAHEVHVHK